MILISNPKIHVFIFYFLQVKVIIIINFELYT